MKHEPVSYLTSGGTSGLHGEAVQARSMEFAVLTDRDVLTICKK